MPQRTFPIPGTSNRCEGPTHSQLCDNLVYSFHPFSQPSCRSESHLLFWWLSIRLLVTIIPWSFHTLSSQASQFHASFYDCCIFFSSTMAILFQQFRFIKGCSSFFVMFDSNHIICNKYRHTFLPSPVPPWSYSSCPFCIRECCSHRESIIPSSCSRISDIMRGAQLWRQTYFTKPAAGTFQILTNLFFCPKTNTRRARHTGGTWKLMLKWLGHR